MTKDLYLSIVLKSASIQCRTPQIIESKSNIVINRISIIPSAITYIDLFPCVSQTASRQIFLFNSLIY